MKIGYDVSQTGANRAGCGWYTRSLIETIAAIDDSNHYVLYPTFGDHFWARSAGSDTVRIERASFTTGPRQKSPESMSRVWRDLTPAVWESLGAPDIVHANNFFCPQPPAGSRIVYTLYDLSFLHHPDWSTESNRIACFEGALDASLYADMVIAISEFSRADFLTSFPHFPAERITVAPPASRFATGSTESQPPPGGDLKPGRFWLHVGTDEPRKNLDRLLAAYEKVRSGDPEPMPLVLVGSKGWLTDDLNRRIRERTAPDAVYDLHYVDDRQLRWLYENCFSFVFPSVFEGFGMPVLEALSLGAPVIASDTTSIPEIAGDAAALVDPLRVESIAAAMYALVRDPKSRLSMIEAGRRAARRFSWEDTAGRVVETYQRAMQLPLRRHQSAEPR